MFSSPPLPSSSPPSLSLLPRLFPRFPSLSRSFLRPFRARVLSASRRPPAPQTSGTFSSLPTRRRGIRSGRNSRGGSRTTLVLFAVVLSLSKKSQKKFSSSLKGRALTLRSFGTTTTPPPRFLKCGNSTSHPQEKKREFFPSLFLSCDMMFRVLNKTLNKTPQRKKRRERGGKETLQCFRCKNAHDVLGKRIVHNNRRSTYLLTPFPFVLVRSSSNKTALYYSKRERERESSVFGEEEEEEEEERPTTRTALTIH